MREIEIMLSSIYLMANLNQSAENILWMQNILKISDDEITFVTGKDAVEGILKYKNELQIDDQLRWHALSWLGK